MAVRRPFAPATTSGRAPRRRPLWNGKAGAFASARLVGHQWVVVSGEASPEVIGRWRARRQYIGQLEALAAVSTYYTLADGAPLPDGGRSHALRGRDVIHYVDNFGALACL
eukprot:scaffold9807_cov115-Isochrysis_galbana.AAC.1